MLMDWSLNSLEYLVKIKTDLTCADIFFIKPAFQMMVDNVMIQSCLNGVLCSSMKASKALDFRR